MIYIDRDGVLVRDMCAEDARLLFEMEREARYGDAENRFPGRVSDAAAGKCAALVAEADGLPIGYVHVYWESDEGPFAGTGVPCIEDFGVLMKYRRHGAGTLLMDIAEKLAAARSERVWLAVGLHHWYGPAQRMYGKRGYVPDGTGVWYKGKVCPAYAPCENNDELLMYLVKKLRKD